MTIDSGKIKELESRVGVEEKPLVYEIEKGMIKRFARAIGDPNPLWQNEEYGVKAGYGGIIASLNFVLTLGFGKILQDLISDPEITVLHGSTELENYKEIRPGDVITVTNKIRNIRERQGSTGKMLFVTIEMVYKNQKKELVAECRQMTIIY